MITLRNIARLTAVAMTLVLVGGVVTPNAAYAQSKKDKARQKDKNLMRNLGVGAGAAAVYEGLHGRTTNAVVIGAGAALAGKKYEDSRKAQRREGGTYKVYRYRSGKRVGYTQFVNNRRSGYHRIGG